MSETPAGKRIVPALPPHRGAETAVLVLFAVGASLALGFVVVYALGSLPHETQLLGACLGLSLLALAAALVVTGRRLVVTEELTEEYPAEEHPGEQETVARLATRAPTGSRAAVCSRSGCSAPAGRSGSRC